MYLWSHFGTFFIHEQGGSIIHLDDQGSNKTSNMKPNILVLHHNKTMSPKSIFIAFDMQLLSCWKFNLCQNSSHFFMSEQLKK